MDENLRLRERLLSRLADLRLSSHSDRHIWHLQTPWSCEKQIYLKQICRLISSGSIDGKQPKSNSHIQHIVQSFCVPQHCLLKKAGVPSLLHLTSLFTQAYRGHVFLQPPITETILQICFPLRI